MKHLALTMVLLAGCGGSNFEIGSAADDAAELDGDGNVDAEELDAADSGAVSVDTANDSRADTAPPVVDTAPAVDTSPTVDTSPAVDSTPTTDSGAIVDTAKDTGSPPVTYAYPVFGDDWTPGSRPENQLGITGDYVKGARVVGFHTKATLTLNMTPMSTYSITVAFLIDGKKFDERTLAPSDTTKTFVATMGPDLFSGGHWFELRVTGCSPACGTGSFKIANSSSTLRLDP